VIAYLGRYTGWSPGELKQMPLSELRLYADAVDDIIREENKT
jgi:hypothetical protein